MNKSLISFALLLCVISFTPFAHAASYGVIISNSNNNTINIGLIDYSNPSQTYPPSLTVSGLQYNSLGYYQAAAYNYAKKLLTFVATDTATGSTYLYVVDCNKWKVLSSLNIQAGDGSGFRGLAVDSSTDTPYNTWLTYQSGDTLSVSQLDVFTLKAKTIETFPGAFYTSAIGGTRDYSLTFSNSSGLFVKQYSRYGDLTVEQQVGFSINVTPKGPVNMVDTINDMFSSVIITNNDGSTYCAIAGLNWQQAQFTVTNMVSHTNFFPTANIGDLHNFKLFYSIGFIGSQYYVYTYNAVEYKLLSVVPISTPILAAF
ncbi:hypothetical protein CYY_001569 [Polysphondylium violaceum]|uniref:Carbohydrate binding domain-containing protein n=1 Tax=Polysphondylium violaceum TaxID=133409 RepID=A0A8J4Q1R3_9MYCE|nr:hypothetical protein CYY_001569 [Polysphondylium violaceum]